MRTVWAVARQTFAECLRMKLAVAFIVLLAGSLAVLPLVMTGDGTLAGAIRTALNYSVSITEVLLSLLTLMMVISVVTGDVHRKTIFLLAVKPAARWQYMVGRWLGVVLLSGLLLGIAGVTIGLIAQHLRDQPATSPVDRQAVETEIFAARQQIRPQPPDFQTWVNRRIRQLDQEGTFEQALNDFMVRENITRDQARRRLEAELLDQARKRYEAVAPGRVLAWRFDGLALQGATRTGAGQVLARRDDLRTIRVRTSNDILARAVRGSPIEIDQTPARVRGVGDDFFDASFEPEAFARSEISGLADGDSVRVTVQPMLQFHYEAEPIGDIGGAGTLFRVLEFRRPSGEVVYRLAGQGPVDTPTTVSVPAVAELLSGSVVVVYANVPEPRMGPSAMAPQLTTVKIEAESVSLLYRVGSFGWNFVRALLLVFCQLAFLAAMGIFFASFLSFPVATLASLVLLGGGWILDWLLPSVVRGGDVISVFGRLVLGIIQIVMPDLSQTSPGERLVDGLLIGWGDVLSAVIWAVVIRCGVYLLAGCAIFSRRELAKVQV